MKRLALILAIFLLPPLGLRAQDKAGYEALDSLLTVYCESMQLEENETKQRECDFMISSCADSLTREHVARALFDHYAGSMVMGEEAVAIYIYDNWFANGKLSIGGEYVAMDAEIFATFNRQNLIGCDAPRITLEKPCGGKMEIPAEGRTSILFFFDTACSKCRFTIAALPAALDEVDFPVNFYAIYCGSDKKSWAEFRRDFRLGNPKIKVTHLWDPDYDSDYQLKYGVISTPKTFVVEPQGTILGRRLEPDSLKELMVYAGIILDTYSKHYKSE